MDQYARGLFSNPFGIHHCLFFSGICEGEHGFGVGVSGDALTRGMHPNEHDGDCHGAPTNLMHLIMDPLA